MLHPKIHWDEFQTELEGRRIYGLKIKNCGNSPIKFQKTAWIRKNSHNQELSKFTEIERVIWNKNQNHDWSAQICQGATIEDLDEEAILKARKQATDKATGDKRRIFENCQTNLEFLDKTRITKNGQITNTAMLLLGKEEKAFDLIPFSQSLEIIWVDMLTGQKREGGKFYPPFVVSVDKLASKIRISKHDYMERIAGMHTTNRRFVDQYELKSIREALHNCIAHQDYTANKRIVMEEFANKLYFKNAGFSKISDQEYEQMIIATFTPEDYRNEFLAKAMDTINMIERLGSGQKSIFEYAKSVFLPLPDRKNNISENKFEYTIYGSKIDETFAQILQDRKDLDVGVILLLDRTQKFSSGISEKQINKEQHKILKKLKLVEGRYPNIYLSLELEKLFGNEENHDQNELKANFRNIFETTILIWLKKHKNGKNKQEIINYTLENLPIAKNLPTTKLKKDIENSLQKLKGNRLIYSEGTLKNTKYFKI